jgi:hypothetical protein
MHIRCTGVVKSVFKHSGEEKRIPEVRSLCHPSRGYVGLIHHRTEGPAHETMDIRQARIVAITERKVL